MSFLFLLLCDEYGFLTETVKTIYVFSLLMLGGGASIVIGDNHYDDKIKIALSIGTIVLLLLGLFAAFFIKVENITKYGTNLQMETLKRCATESQSNQISLENISQIMRECRNADKEKDFQNSLFNK